MPIWRAWPLHVVARALSLALDLCEGLLRLQQGVAAAEALEEVKAGRATLEGPLEGGVCVLKALPL